MNISDIRRIDDTPHSQRVYNLYFTATDKTPYWEFICQVTGTMRAHRALVSLRDVTPGAWAQRYREPVALLPAPAPTGFVG